MDKHLSYMQYPGRVSFFDPHIARERKGYNSRKSFLAMLKDLAVPKGAEVKYENTKLYFAHVENEITKMSPVPKRNSGG